MKLKQAILAQALRSDGLSGARPCNPKVFHASDAGTCRRCVYFKAIGRKPENGCATKVEEAELSIKLADGKLHQEAIAILIRQAPGIHLTNEEQCYVLPVDDFVIVGHPDGVVHDVAAKERYVLEVKGLSRFYGLWKKPDEDLEALRDSYPSAIKQGRLYSYMIDTNGLKVIVKNKDTSEMREYTFPRDAEVEERVINRFREVRAAIIAEKPPACDYMKGDKATKYCRYPAECGSGK